MIPSGNKVILLGRVASAPEHRVSGLGEDVTNFILMTEDTWPTHLGVTRQMKERHRITAYRDLALIAVNKLAIHSAVYVEGRLHWGTHTGPDGVELPSVDVIVERLQFIGRPDKIKS
jgi:single stranded DNA-binding protein